MFISVKEYNKKIKGLLEDKVKVTCAYLLEKNYSDTGSQTYGYFCSSLDSIHFLGVEENIALWSVYCNSYKYDDKFKYFYTDMNGNLLFGNFFFDYASTFSDGCALIQTVHCEPRMKTFILDIRSQQVLSIPNSFKDVNQIMHNNVSVLDGDTNKWGSYIIHPETGVWTPDIPFIWDDLAFSRDEEKVYVGLTESCFYYPNMDDTPYYRMNSDWDKPLEIKKYRVTHMLKQESYTLDAFRKYGKLGCIRLVRDFDRYIDENLLYEQIDYTNDSEIVETGDIKDYTLKLSCLR